MRRISACCLVLVALTEPLLAQPENPVPEEAKVLAELKPSSHQIDDDGHIVSLIFPPWTKKGAWFGAGVTNEQLASLQKLPYLTSINFFDCPNITGEGLAHIVKVKGLKQLWFDEKNQIEPSDFSQLAQLSNLEVLYIHRPLEAEDLAFLKKMPQLRELYLNGTSVTDEAMEHLEGLTNLQRLELSGSRVTDVGLAHLENLNQLEIVRLPANTTPVGLQHFEKMTHLRTIWIGDKHPDNTATPPRLPIADFLRLMVDKQHRSHAEAFRAMRFKCEVDEEGNVIELHLAEDHDTPIVTDAMVPYLNQLTHLRVLSLRTNDLTDVGFRMIMPSDTLVSLSLWNTKIGEHGLSHLPAFPNLENLTVPSQADDADMKHVARLSRLESLNAATNNITSLGVKHLEGLTQLKHLYLSNSKVDDSGAPSLAKLQNLRTLNLQSTAMTDEGLKLIGELELLVSLHLDGTAITDKGLPHLRPLTNLEELSTKKTDVTTKARVHLFHNLQSRSAEEVLTLERVRIEKDDTGRIEEVHCSSRRTKNSESDPYLRLMGQLPDVKYIRLYFLELTPESVRYLKNASTLKKISFYACKNVNNDVLAALKELDQLETLDLGRVSGVTEEGLEHIKEMKNLKFISSNGANITPEALERLERELPKCEVVFKFIWTNSGEN